MQFAAGFLVKDGGEAFGINSLLCCALGGGVAFVLSRICAKHWSLFRIIGGMLAGKFLPSKYLWLFQSYYQFLYS